MKWNRMDTVPADGRVILLVSPSGVVGIASLKKLSFEDGYFLSGSVAWAGKRFPGDVNSVWLGGWSANDAVGWRELDES